MIETDNIQNKYTIIDDRIIFSKDIEIIHDSFSNIIKENNIKHIEFEEGSKLTSVGDYAFCELDNIESVDFSNCQLLEDVGKGAMSYCSNLQLVNFGGCEKLYELGEFTFESSAKLKKVNLTFCYDLQYIPRACFERCESLEYIDLRTNSNLQFIDEYAFSHCYSLKKVKFPKSERFKEISSFAFSWCKAIENIELSGTNIEVIGRYTFINCINLKTIDLSNCTNLKKCKMIKVENDGEESRQLDLIDLRGCNKLHYFGNISSKNIRLSFIDKFTGIKFCSDFDKDTNFEIYDRNNNVALKFKNDGSSNFEKLTPYSIGLYYYAKKKYPNNVAHKIPVTLYNTLTSPKQMDIAVKNLDKLLDFTNERSEALKIGGTRFVYYHLLNTLGFFGFDNADKNEILIYKNALAKDLLMHKVVNNIKSASNKDYINKLLQQKMNEIAKSYSLESLVLKFVENNIKNSPKEKELIKCLLPNTYTSFNPYVVQYAQFLVRNINDIMDKSVYLPEGDADYEELNKGYLPIYQIQCNFEEILLNSNKKVITRSENQRLTIEDCKSVNCYKNIKEGNEEVARLCNNAHLSQAGFDFLQDLFEKGKAVKGEQVLTVVPDDAESDITYEFIEKDNPIGLVLGNITNCCQRYKSAGESCMIDGVTNKYSGFVTFKYKDKIIGQSWVWYNPDNNMIALDNIEVPDVHFDLVNKEHKEEVMACLQRLSDNFCKTMKNKGYRINSVVIGAANTDIESLDERYTIDKNEIKCPYAKYSDISKDGHYVVYENKEKTNINSRQEDIIYD